MIVDSDATITNSFDITLENEDYTIGKILEYILYETHYITNRTLTFCGFRKPHPHINLSIIRLGFTSAVDKNVVAEYIVEAAQNAIKYFQKLLPHFGQTHPDELLAVQSAIPKTNTVKSQNTKKTEPLEQPLTAKSVTAESATAKSATAKSATAKSATAKSVTAESATAKSATAEPSEPTSEEDIDESSISEVPISIPGTAEEIEVEKTLG